MSSEKKRFAERLNDALDNIQFPKSGAGRISRLAEYLGTENKETGKWLKGEVFPPTSVLVRLAELTKTRSNWLLSGHGDPYPDDKHPRGPGKNPPPTGKVKLSNEAFELGLAWMKLPEPQRIAIAKVIEELAAASKKS